PILGSTRVPRAGEACPERSRRGVAPKRTFLLIPKARRGSRGSGKSPRTRDGFAGTRERATQILCARGVIVDLIEVYSCFALDCPQCHSFLKQFRPTESPSFRICSVTMTKEWGRFLIREQM